jgi:hypothetical protein
MTTVFAMHNKAVLEMVNGIFKYAVYYFKEAADIKEVLLGSKHNSVIETLEQLAVAMYGMEAYDQSHATLRCIHARSSSRVLATRIWNGIACLHFQKGEYDFAFKCVRRAMVGNDEGEVAPTIAMANHGYMQLAQGIAAGRETLIAADDVSADCQQFPSRTTSPSTLQLTFLSFSNSRNGLAPTMKSFRVSATT